MAVEKMQGFSRLEQFVEELSEEERAKELKQEKKRRRRKNRRKNANCRFDMSEQEAEDKEKCLDEVGLQPRKYQLGVRNRMLPFWNNSVILPAILW